jgi:fatty-acyl-CoA synthase
VALMNEDGSVCIVGRTKDMIVRGGENIYPTEIEQFLFQHPLIEDIHVNIKQIIRHAT